MFVEIATVFTVFVAPAPVAMQSGTGTIIDATPAAPVPAPPIQLGSPACGTSGGVMSTDVTLPPDDCTLVVLPPFTRVGRR